MTATNTLPPSRRRWSFRSRLTAAVAAAFALSGAVLVLVQYLIFNAVFSSNAMSILNASVTNIEKTAPGNPAEDVDASIQAAETSSEITVEAMSTDVLAQTMLWSLLLVVVFALFAWLLAWIVARRTMGRVHHISATAREITEQDLSRRLDLPGPADEIKELGDTIDSMLSRLQFAFETQSRFIANASHELRTPLTATRLTLEVPLNQGRVHETARPIVERALKTTRRSERLVESLLTLARDPATLVGAAEAIDLREIVTTVVDEMRQAAQERDMSISVDAVESVIDGNPLLLRQLVENLVDNAITHGEKGGPIDITVTCDEQIVQLQVSSRGQVLDAAMAQQLRRPFERHSSAGTTPSTSELGPSRPGIGLGLSIVDSITLAHQGTLNLAARPGGGLVTTVSLPTS